MTNFKSVRQVKTRTLFVLALVALAACAITGCASYLNAVVQTASYAIKGQPGGDSTRLNPAFRYLRVIIKGRVVFVALGDIDKHPDGPIEIYYSSGHEVIRLQNGHVVGANGLLTEWRNVSQTDMPAWAATARAGQPVAWQRTRDVMPGYRFGIHDKLVLGVIPPPQKSALQDLSPESLTWFEEQHQTASGVSATKWLPNLSKTEETLPPARYAIDFANGRETVVYSEQCLAPDLCFSWQRWTPKKP